MKLPAPHPRRAPTRPGFVARSWPTGHGRVAVAGIRGAMWALVGVLGAGWAWAEPAEGVPVDAAPVVAPVAAPAPLGEDVREAPPMETGGNVWKQTPREYDGVDIVEKLGDTLPLDLTFTNEFGERVPLRRYWTGDRPVILALVYYNCPMLCNMVLNGLIDGLRDLAWTAGTEFDIVTVSIDHRETPDLAREKKKTYLSQLARPGAERGWHFLVGDVQEIRQLAEAVGFSYRYDARQMEYVHGAAIFMSSPSGKLTRYLYGVQFPSRQLRLGLTEAGEGKVGTVIDRVLLRCYHFDPDRRRYGVYVWGVMRLGGGLTVLVLGGMLMFFWRRERRRGEI